MEIEFQLSKSSTSFLVGHTCTPQYKQMKSVRQENELSIGHFVFETHFMVVFSEEIISND